MGFFQDLKEDLSQAVNEQQKETQQDTIESEKTLDDEVLDDEVLDEPAGEAIGEKTNPEKQQDEAKRSVLEGQSKALAEVKNEQETSLEEEAQKLREVPDEVVADMLRSRDTVADVLEKVNAENWEVKQKTKLTGVAMDENSVITVGMTITGNVVSKGSLEVKGTIIGDVETLGKLDVKGTIKGNSRAAEVFVESARINGEVHSESTIQISRSSVIIGSIFGKSAVIAGAVKGDIDVKGPVVLDTSAIVMGNIKSKSVQINNGAVIEGLCSQCYADVSPTTFFDEYKG